MLAPLTSVAKVFHLWNGVYTRSSSGNKALLYASLPLLSTMKNSKSSAAMSSRLSSSRLCRPMVSILVSRTIEIVVTVYPTFFTWIGSVPVIPCQRVSIGATLLTMGLVPLVGAERSSVTVRLVFSSPAFMSYLRYLAPGVLSVSRYGFWFANAIKR